MLTFYLYNPADDDSFEDDFLPKSAINIRDFLDNPPFWKPNLEKVILIFNGISMSSDEDFNPFGILEHILPQLIELKKRLLNGEFALLRTCIYSEPLFFIFEPKGHLTCFSSLGRLPSPYYSYYPAAKSPNFFKEVNQRKELYDFVESNNKGNWKETLTGNLPEIKDIEYLTDPFMTSVNEQIELGNELIEFLRKPS
ncbi:hypothetical protein ACHRV5_12950 [Flavobacterium sp. FlaQc-52]|jgi:hypothetical protein|uniref:hypothetical protein n=1 Tax=Flavobacterium sp. FlaQc-52 TaxID=3374185 RepID=UPI00375849BF